MLCVTERDFCCAVMVVQLHFVNHVLVSKPKNLRIGFVPSGQFFFRLV